MRKTMLLLPAICAALAACDSGVENVRPIEGEASSQAGGEGAAGAVNVSGPAIRVVGSSTVYPFTTTVAEQFKRQYPQAATPIVESTGTGGGIKLFCGGVGPRHPDIANASRRIKASELAMCRENGVAQVVEVQIGMDGIALVQARTATPIALGARDIYLALAATTPDGKPNKARTWRDINPKLPATKIEVLGPPPTSGTRDAFNELIMEAGCETFPEVKALKESDEAAFRTRCTKLREDGAFVEAGENDNLIVQKLVGNPNAVGIFGYSYLEGNNDQVRGVTLDGVAPTYENIASLDYVAARPLYIYVKGEHVRAKPAIQAFLAEYSREGAWGPGGYLTARGLIAAPERTRLQSVRNATELIALDPAELE